MIRRVMVPLAAAMLALAGQAVAQSAFPAPPARASAFPPVNGSAFPPVNGSAPVATIAAPPTGAFSAAPAAPMGGGFGPPGQQAGPSEACMKEFVALREETEKQAKALQAAGARKVGPDVACKLIGNYSKAEAKWLKFVETNASRCGMPPQVPEQLKKNHGNTEGMQQRVCNAAQNMQRGPAGPSLSEVLGSSTSLPESNLGAAKKGGTTFDTLNGNVLAR